MIIRMWWENWNHCLIRRRGQGHPHDILLFLMMLLLHILGRKNMLFVFSRNPKSPSVPCPPMWVDWVVASWIILMGTLTYPFSLSALALVCGVS